MPKFLRCLIFQAHHGFYLALVYSANANTVDITNTCVPAGEVVDQMIIRMFWQVIPV